MHAVDPDVVFRAFADRTRLRILNLLHEGEICVGDLVAIIAAPQPTVSRHLGHLRRAGLVRAERDGNWCFYALAPPGSPLQARLLECIGCCLGDVPRLRRDLARLRRLRARGGCCERVRSARGAAGATACR